MYKVGHVYDQLNTLRLLNEIICHFDDAERDIQLEDYVSAESAILELIQQAKTLKQLLHLIPLRSEAICTLETNDDLKVARLIKLETTCREIASDAHCIMTEIKKLPLGCTDFDFSNDFKISFCSNIGEVLLCKDVSLIDENANVYLQLKEHRGLSNNTFMFDQLGQYAPPLWIDDILNLNTVELEIVFSVKRRYELNQ